MVKLRAEVLVNALQIIRKIFDDHRIVLRVVHHDEMVGFLASHAGQLVEQDEVVGRAIIEWIDGISRIQHRFGIVLIAALRQQQPKAISCRRPPAGALDGFFIHLFSAWILPHG